MKLLTRIALILTLSLLTAPVLLLKGCGDALIGGSSGGCSDSVAPFDSKIIATTLSAATVAPATSWCYPSISFQVLGPDGKPLNDVCVEVLTSDLVTQHTAMDCWDHPLSDFTTYGKTKTDSTGSVMLDFLIPDPCRGGSGSTSLSAWVKVNSGPATGLATAAIAISPVCP